MRKISFAFLLTLFFSMIGNRAFASVVIDGIYYYFNGDEAIVTNDISVNYIGDIVIPETVTYNGKQYTVTTIESYAFETGITMESISIPKTIKSIGQGAFNGCWNLKKVIISDLLSWCRISFSSYGDSNPLKLAHYLYSDKDTQITDVVIPNEITTITSNMFKYCKSIKSITLPNTITSIEYSSFMGCENITSLTINNSYLASSMDISDVFGSGVSECIIGDEVTDINSNLFSSCKNLKSITIGKNVKTIDKNAFFGCNSLEKVIIKDLSAWYNISFGNEYSNPLIHSQHMYYDDNVEIKNLQVPDGISSIASYAFYGWQGLESITIPNTLNTIGIDAFRGCSGLNKLIYNDLSTWCKISFGNRFSNPLYYTHHLYNKNNQELTEIVIPDDITSIKSFAFYGCQGLQSAFFPDKVTNVEYNAFSGCDNLKSVRINNTIVSLDHMMGSLSTIFGAQVEKYILSDDVTSINDNAFSGCSSLTSVNIPNSVTKIGDYAFSGCSSLSSLEIPNNVTYIGKRAFSDCSGITAVVIPSSVTSIGAGAFSGCSNITTVDIPKNVKDIGNGAFSGCANLKKVSINSNEIMSKDYTHRSAMKEIFGEQVEDFIIGNDVIRIGSYAFNNYNKGLNSIIIGDNITSIGSYAFSGSIYVNRGTVSLLTIWNNLYTPLEINSGKILNSPTIAKIDATQTSIKLRVENIYKEYAYTFNGEPLTGNIVTLSGLRPEQSVSGALLKISLGDYSFSPKYTSYSTAPIRKSIKKQNSSASSLTLKGSYTKGDAEVSKMTITVNKISKDGDSITITGLNPNTTYRATYTITVKYGDNLENTYDYTSTSDIRTDALTLTTQQPKVVSLGNVIVAAEANIDDEEKNVGFEWRRTDWTDSFQSNTGTANMVEGTMEGYIHNLNTEKLWKFRPYYLADNGTYYYGDWVGVDPTNTSFFEPTVHTYDKIVVNGNTALVKGYALGGSDDVTVQGFKYWKSAGGSSNRVSSADIPSDAKTVEASGTVMEVSLSDLDYDSSYSYVTFVTTSKGTYYGEIKTFETGKEPLILGDANGDMKVNVSDIVEIVNDILGKPSAKYNRNAADVNGDGQVNVTDIVNVVNIIMTSGSSASARRAASNNSLWLDGGTIRLRNAENYTATQFDINLSEGQSVGDISLSSTSNHQLTWQMVDENTCRVVVYSLSNAPFHTTDDVLFNITLNGSATISNELLIDADGSTTAVERIQQDKPMDVYDLRGNKVRSNVTNLRGLAKGIYIINGKKVILQ